LDQFLKLNAQQSVLLQAVSWLDLANRACESAALRKDQEVIAIQQRLGYDASTASPFCDEEVEGN
jgi:hypothetical protein